MTGGGTWVGKIIDGKPFGWGTYTWSNGNVYEGFFTTSGRSGSGTETFSSGAKYVGEFLHNKRTTGTFYWPNGDKYVGEFKNELPHGQGVYTWHDGTRYEGYMENGKKHGQGTYTSPSGLSYSDIFNNDERTYTTIKTKSYEENDSIKERQYYETLKEQEEQYPNDKNLYYPPLNYICLFDLNFEDPFIAGKRGDLIINKKKDSLSLSYERKGEPRIAIWSSISREGDVFYSDTYITRNGSKFQIDTSTGRAVYERSEISDKNLRFLNMHCIKK